MAKRRITGRFYVFISLVLIGVYFIARQFMPEADSEALVRNASTTFSTMMDAVIIRDETVGSYEGGGRVVYIAKEGQSVAAGDDVCEVYTASYAEKELTRLEATRQSIREYHIEILDNIVDTELDRLENNVQSAALQLKKLVNRKTIGSLLTLVTQLETAMQDRQTYLSQNRREETKLNQLYEEETKRENAIASWRSVKTAQADGRVSFYLDGLEEILTPDNIAVLTSADMRTILQGGMPVIQTDNAATAARTQNVYRIIGDAWYVALIGPQSWNPINGQFFTFQMEGYEDLAYSGTVVQVQKSGTDVIAVLQVNGDVGALINRRYGKAGISTHLSGMSVPVAALDTQNDQTGVWINDVPGGTFVAVNVLSQDGQNALVSPIVEGTLETGQRVLLK